MTIYGSRDPADMNTDPTPLRVVVEPGAVVKGRTRFRENDPYRYSNAKYTHDPRPEYTPTLSHLHNPILAAIRELQDGGDPSKAHSPGFYKEAAAYLTGGVAALGVPITPDHSAHAHRVLTRLATFKETR